MRDNGREINSCPEADRFLGPHLAGETPLKDQLVWRRHREECASCADQWAVERQLRRHYADVSRPVLAPDFGRRLRQRLVAETSAPVTVRRRAASLRRQLLPAYWLVAAVTSCWILASLEGAARSMTVVWVLVVGLVWLGFGSIARAARRRGLDVFDLVFLPAD